MPGKHFREAVDMIRMAMREKNARDGQAGLFSPFAEIIDIPGRVNHSNFLCAGVTQKIKEILKRAELYLIQDQVVR